MKTAGAVFQRIMKKVVGDLQPRCVSIYINVITVYSPLLQQHLADLDAVFARLEAANLKVSVSKTRLAHPEVFVLGHNVSADGIRPHPHQVEAITKMRPPSSAEEFRWFLGAVNFYRQFIPGCSGLANPLFALIRGRFPFRREPFQQAAFARLLEVLSSAPLLWFPNLSKLFYIKTDASQVGIGAALTQEVEPSTRLPVAFASSSFQPAERQYSTTYREGLAVVWAVWYFQSYILGMTFVIITNHASLRALRTKENLKGRMLKWAEALLEHDYDIMYIQRVDNALPDLLSWALLTQNLISPNPSWQYSVKTSTAAAKNHLWVRPSHQGQTI